MSNQGKFSFWSVPLSALLWVDAPAFTPAWRGSIIRAYDPRTNATHDVYTFESDVVGALMPVSQEAAPAAGGGDGVGDGGSDGATVILVRAVNTSTWAWDTLHIDTSFRASQPVTLGTVDIHIDFNTNSVMQCCTREG